jgi:beta-galactosidase
MLRAGLMMVFVFVSSVSFANPRTTVSLNSSWRFIRADAPQAGSVGYDDSSWQSLVQIPHTWNAMDGQAFGAYYRGIGWYRKNISLDPGQRGNRVFLRFGAVNQIAEVFFNGKSLGSHRGGYTAFIFEITDLIEWGKSNVIAVKASNAFDTTVAPVDADYTFFGGMYRGVDLIYTSPVHFSWSEFGSEAIRATADPVSKAAAHLDIRVRLANQTKTSSKVLVVSRLSAKESENFIPVQKTAWTAVEKETLVEHSMEITKPHLWDGRSDPFMYQLTVTISDEKGRLLDELKQKVGFRFFKITSDEGFSLNGRPLELHGVAMHQDKENKGWALSSADRRENIEILNEMGANAVRLCHYPHSPETLDLLDSNGIIAWEEIPLVNTIPNSEAFADSTKTQLLEMIHQLYHHPSIVIWGLFNEVKADPLGLVFQLHRLAKETDSTRSTGGASDRPANFPLHTIPDVIAFNKYNGWYRGTFDDFGPEIDSDHRALPGKPIGITEYGAGASLYPHVENLGHPNIDSKFHPEEWQSLFHESYYHQMQFRPYLMGHFIWNLFDFAATNRHEGQRFGINDKGLVSYGRDQFKDAFYFYRANWNKNSPTLHLAGKRITQLVGPTANIKIYSSFNVVDLEWNGRELGAIFLPVNGVFVFKDVKLARGENKFVAKGRDPKTDAVLTDTATWTYAEH